MLDAGHDVRSQVGRWPQRLKRGNLAGELFEQNTELQASKARTQTEMRATASEGEVIVRAALDIKSERVFEHLLVPIRRYIPNADLLALL